MGRTKPIRYALEMAKRKRYLTATLPDGYVKRIGPTSAPLTHYWRIVADVGGGRSEVFCGHTKSLREATGKREAAADAARQRGWASYTFENAELTDTGTERDKPENPVHIRPHPIGSRRRTRYPSPDRGRKISDG